MMLTGKHIAKAARCQRAPALAALCIAIGYVIALAIFTAERDSPEFKDRHTTIFYPG
ncbi:hypothetical protein [Mesorhizobium sp. ANAO-SY3R2]|uniref:hypothetical protein n=1 Tax=Mesorhizobium sp. ANAO-SY3R2 TaxID=3166644 RepID=UPI00366DD7BC